MGDPNFALGNLTIALPFIQSALSRVLPFLYLRFPFSRTARELSRENIAAIIR